MANIHPTAVVDPKAKLHDSVIVGPYAVIGPDVTIGADTVVDAHVVISGVTTIGERNRFYSFGSIGCDPQDKKYKGEPTRLVIGNGNAFFQNVTVSTGTVQDESLTSIGDDNWIMAYVHIAHDCRIGSGTIFANNVTLAGHVYVDDFAFLGGFTTVHQFCKIGAYAMSAFTAAISQDVPPFVVAAGNRAKPAGVHSEGMRRHGFTAEQIAQVKKAYRVLYRQSLSLDESLAALDELAASSADVARFAGFIRTSERGFIR
ncbi:UDP-N-acetylglucosamine acyltransferase [Silvimonas terrae]|uniref:Acyl-[acyl-carrier-protein]--UDP-N-acetylglucosamine O-acyltransferase n=1 Tax=Silvimonas terrae TaxID=300266 RepID=A0A840RCG7_9NEIS|nr:acyl-ACP--UDP-N-acetylglucosamine O-acyltransferase [Silvimonas terrae]MBB5190050.1 UDP-N-acetylglucosamine acyltransferase [Silvimonas terrae]